MSMSKRIVLGLSAAAITVALAGVGFATGQADSAQNPPSGRGGPGRFGGPGGPGFGRGGPGGRGGAMGVLGPMMIERLDLTADQKDRVKQIVDSHRDGSAGHRPTNDGGSQRAGRGDHQRQFR